MTFRSGDPDSTIAYLRSLEDRIARLERAARGSSKVGTTELRLTSGRKYDSLLVIGDSISQFDRLYNLGTDGKWRSNAGAVTQNRWQDKLADHLAQGDSVSRYLPTVNPPEDSSDYTVEGSGSFRQWDYSCIGATSEWMSDSLKDGRYLPPPVTVDLMVVLLGINDWSTDPQISPDSFYDGMHQIIAERGIRWSNLVIVKPWQWDRPVVGSAPWSDYLAKIDSLGAATGGTVVTLMEGIVGDDLAPDGVHPSQAGHDFIYEKVRDAVTGMERRPVVRNSVASTSAGTTIGGDAPGIVLGDWKIQPLSDGSLGAVNIFSGVSTTIA